MVIKNFAQLATTPLRRTALEIIEAGFEAIRTKDVIAQQVKLEGSLLKIKDQTFNLDLYSHLYVFGAGKGSFDAVAALEEVLKERITYGVVVDVRGGHLKRVGTVVGTHPDPSQANVEATKLIMKMVQEAPKTSLILFVLTGGGSALLTAPFEINFRSKAKIIESLMKANADIYELNVVRKHLSLVKGGRLAQLAYPTQVAALIFSDVPGNDTSTIASGPTSLDMTTNEDAAAVLKKRGVWDQLSLEALEFSETPKDPKYFEKVKNIVLQDPSSVAFAMQDKAKKLGWPSRIYSTDLQGEAGNLGIILLSSAKKGEILLACGESTVKVTGQGVGGRNQHLVLSCLRNLKPNQVLVAAASDGHDHSDSAGAIADEHSFHRAVQVGLDPDEFLKRADSFEFFQRLGDSLQTGLLESNVSDFYLVVEQ